MTDYDKKLEYINSQAPPDIWGWDRVLDRANQKLYPFYYFRNFNNTLQWNSGPRPEPFKCDYCGGQFSTNVPGYYTAYIVWESATDVRICCSVRHCRKGQKAYDFMEQIYGFPEPIELKKYADSEPHEMIWHMWFKHGPYKYGLKQFIRGITWEKFATLVHVGTYRGGTYIRDKNGTLDWEGSKLIYRKSIGGKPFISLTKADIISHLNEILEANRPTGQLSLFDDLFSAA